MSRPLIATIDLAAIRANYLLAKRLHGGCAIAAVKANAYGHGAVEVAKALDEIADGFGVAAIEEAIELRQAGIRAPILLLEGFFEADELAKIEQYELWTALHSPAQVAAIEQAKITKPLTVWLKLDSGMHRLGLTEAEFKEAYQRLAASNKVAKLVGMSHFARADETACPMTAAQTQRFMAVLEGMPIETSLCNSGAIVAWPQARTQWARPGIMIYGGRCTDGAVPEDLQPAMHLDSQIIAVRELAAGEPIGYGGQFVAERAMRMGVVACGYADGYPRVAPTGTPVLVDGQRTRLVGRVSMDMLTVDLSDLPQAQLGSAVRLWGKGLAASEIAAAAGTIDYELFCNLKRAHRIYIG